MTFTFEMRNAPVPTDAVADEARELHALAESLAVRAPILADPIDEAATQFERALSAAHPKQAEEAAERFVHDLRRLWLRHAAEMTADTFRSPTKAERARLARHDEEPFGYERDLHPLQLEARCDHFFPAPPADWHAEHVLFCSGQAAMTACLVGLDTAAGFGAARPLRLAHCGAYFETHALIAAMPALLAPSRDVSEADVVIIETIACGGRFTQTDTAALCQQIAPGPKPRVIIFDTTLAGEDDGLNERLVQVGASASLVLRVNSGLKLLQGGFELANVGIVTVFSRQGASAFGDALRTLRTLADSGLRAADIAALDAPWFLDRPSTRAYEKAVFAHNRALAHTVAEKNKRFVPVSHPALWTPPSRAPYCVFHLKNPDLAAYELLEREIEAEARRQDILFENGGSFGFRGHRFEIVQPQTGEAQFLRVAMGRRGGWSCQGVIALMCELARR